MEQLTRAMGWIGGIRWRDRDPASVAEALRRDGFSVDGPTSNGRFEMQLGRLRVLIEAPEGVAREGLEIEAKGLGLEADPDALSRADVGQHPRSEHPNGVAGVAAIGLATVDAERAMRDGPPLSWQRAGDDALLGARAWRALARETQVLLLEPSTEGPLAAALARMGEGPVALYLSRDRPAAHGTEATLEPRPWPLGRAARLVSTRRPWGPFVLLVEPEPDATSAPGERSRPADAGRRRGADG